MISTVPLLLLALAAGATAAPHEVVENIKPDNGLDKGSWGATEICRDRSYAFAFQIKYVEPDLWDRTEVNAIRLYCRTGEGVLTGAISSDMGPYGEWLGIRVCPAGEVMVGLKAKVMPFEEGPYDNRGLMNLQMECSGGEVLDGMYGVPEEGPAVSREMTVIEDREVEAVHLRINSSAHLTEDTLWWGSWSVCSEGNKVCGIRTRVEGEHTWIDDLGVADVTMFCCT